MSHVRTKAFLPSSIIPGKPRAAQRVLYPAQGSKPLSKKSGVRMRRNKMSYCCRPKWRTPRDRWWSRDLCPYPVKGSGSSVLSQGSWHIRSENTSFWLLGGTDRDLHSGAPVAENPSGTGRRTEKGMNPSKEKGGQAPGSGGNAIPRVLCNSHLRKRLALR